MSILDVLKFVAVISSTDAVALTFIHEDTKPKLFSILFGEGIINNAVYIVIYNIIKKFSGSGQPFTGETIINKLGISVKLFGLSFFIELELFPS